MLDYRVISIGTLASHPLWSEKSAARTGHATTTLLTSDGANILIDPSLPAQALLARLSERTSLKPTQITHVFLTSFEPERRRALPSFENATWLIHEPEREAARAAINSSLEQAQDARDQELASMYKQELALLERCKDAADQIAPHVDLFPLPGVTAGTCGLLLALQSSTLLISGDAIPTLEHLKDGKVLPYCADIEQAQESFREAIEISDMLILGRDNLTLNPLRRI